MRPFDFQSAKQWVRRSSGTQVILRPAPKVSLGVGIVASKIGPSCVQVVSALAQAPAETNYGRNAEFAAVARRSGSLRRTLPTSPPGTAVLQPSKRTVPESLLNISDGMLCVAVIGQHQSWVQIDGEQPRPGHRPRRSDQRVLVQQTCALSTIGLTPESSQPLFPMDLLE